MQYVTTFDINTLPDIETVRKHKTSKCAYINAPFAFDIETTSYIDKDGNKPPFFSAGFQTQLSGTGSEETVSLWFHSISPWRLVPLPYLIESGKEVEQ